MRGTWREGSFTGDPERYVKEMSREIKLSCKRVSLSIGAPLRNLEGIRLPGLSEKKGRYIWVPFLDTEDIKILSPGANWNFGEGTELW
jgi:hypothetical protein